MKFLKNNSYDIVKLFINQIGIAIFSLVLYTAVGFVEDDGLKGTLKCALSIFSLLFYFALIYTVSWEYGAKDKVKIDSGRHKIPKLQGLYLGLCANAVNFILAGISVISMALYMSTTAEWLYTTFGLVQLFMRFIMSAYIGVIQGASDLFGLAANTNTDYLFESFGYLLLPLLAVGVVVFGYFMGMSNKRIFSSSTTVKKD